MRSGASGPGEAAGPSVRACAACASIHCDSGERCAARKVKCFICGGKGHFKVMCPVRKSKKIYELYEDYDEDDEKDVSKSWYDSRARSLPELKVGDNVVALEGPRREYARVLRRAAQPRSYFVLDGAGRVLRRNRRHLVRVSSPDPEPSPATSSRRTTCEEDVTQKDTGLNHSSGESECYDSCPELYDDASSNSSVGQIHKRTERAAARVAKEKLKFMK
ncbi:hypothetical protein HF086_013403 [Spodoptera exigua]|uniref:CCHC-type domain-containing protein n=1 Tax=Spodoptera exigua TaxID=7107 RepID=A0A922MJG8_SPOEX|nr:hypothetical protein HF086_013403 [Spodoptera exigua]